MAVEDWKIEASTRRCARCEAEIPAEVDFFSAIAREDPAFRRLDYCRACWRSGDVDVGAAFAFWRTRWSPSPPRERRRVRFDPEVALEFFLRLAEEDEPGEEGRKLQYLIGLLLLRRKRLRLERTEERDGVRVLWLAGREGAEHPVVDPGLPAEELATVRDRLGDLLDMDLPGGAGAEGPPGSEGEGPAGEGGAVPRDG